MVTGLGGVLKARDAKQGGPQAPGSHRLFSSLQFVSGGENRGLQQLGEGDVPSDNVDIPEEGGPRGGWSANADELEGGGWLESDDIEDF